MDIPFLKFLVSKGEIDETSVYWIGRWAMRNQEPLGMVAVEHGLIIGRQIDDILDRQRHCDLRFGELALEMGLLREAQVDALLQIQKLRISTSIIEALGLAGVIPLERGVQLLSEFVREEPGAIIRFVEATAGSQD